MVGRKRTRCQQCAKATTACHAKAGNAKCDRCLEKGLDCRPQSPKAGSTSKSGTKSPPTKKIRTDTGHLDAARSDGTSQTANAELARKEGLATKPSISNEDRAYYDELRKGVPPYTPQLDSIHDELLERSRIIQAWQDFTHSGQLEIKESGEYTPNTLDRTLQKRNVYVAEDYYRSFGPVVHLRDAPKRGNRDFQVVRVESFEVRRPGMEEESRIAWAIWVNDMFNPLDHPLVLYKYFTELVSTDDKVPNKKKNQQARTKQGYVNIGLEGVLEDDLCSSEADAQVLGTICCDLLDRLPNPIQETEWAKIVTTGGVYVPDASRRMIETLALHAWKPNLQRDALFPGFLPDGKTSFFSHVSPTLIKNKLVFKFPALPVGTTSMTYMTRSITLDMSATDKILERTPEGPECFYLPPVAWPNDQPESSKAAVSRLLSYVYFKMFGYVGTFDQLHERLRKLLHYHSGVQDPGKPQEIPMPQRTGTYSGKPLFIANRAVLQIAIGSSVVHSLTITLPPVLSQLTLPGRLALAYVSNRALKKQAEGVDIANILQELYLAAAEVELDLVTQRQMLDDQFIKDTDLDPARQCRCCALCGQVKLYNEFIRLDDDRLVCQKHDPPVFGLSIDPAWQPSAEQEPALLVTADQKSRKPSTKLKTKLAAKDVPLRSLTNLDANDISYLNNGQAHVIKSIQLADRREQLCGGHSIDQEAAVTKLRSFTLDAANGVWDDAYDGPRSLSDAVYNGKAAEAVRAMRHAPLHPMRPTLAAVQTLTVVDGRVYYHHPTNLVLTCWVFNVAKSTWPPAILPLMQQAAQQTKSEMADMNLKNSLSKHVARDDKFWQDGTGPWTTYTSSMSLSLVV